MPNAVVVRRNKEKSREAKESLVAVEAKGLDKRGSDESQRLVVRKPGIVRLPKNWTIVSSWRT
jgi:hypothetical protein